MKTTVVAVGLLAAVALLSLIWLSHPYYEDKPDSSLYIVTARSILNGEGYTYLGIPVIMRPPGFSVMLLPVLALFGTNFLALNVYVGLFGVLSVVLLVFQLRPRLGLPVSLAIGAAVWFNPQFQTVCRQVLSDVPATALLLACFLVERWARANDSLRRHAILGVLIGLTTHVRTVTIFLLPAIVLSRLLAVPLTAWRERVRPTLVRAALLFAVSLAVLFPWSLRNGARQPAAPVEEFLLYSYSVAMFHEDPGDPASPEVSAVDVLRRVPRNVPRIARSVGRWMQTGLPAGADTLAGYLVLGCAAVALIRRRRFEEFFVAGALTVLSVYFAFGHRLQLPIYVIAFPAVVELVLELLRKVVREERARIAAVVLMVVPAALELPFPDKREIAEQHELRVEVGRYLEQLPEPAVLASTVGRHWMVRIDRPVITLKHALKRDGPRRALQIIEERDVSVVVIDRDYFLSRRLLRPIERRYRLLRDFGRFVVFDTTSVSSRNPASAAAPASPD
jgi:hypothetical protein